MIILKYVLQGSIVYITLVHIIGLKIYVCPVFQNIQRNYFFYFIFFNFDMYKSVRYLIPALCEHM